MIKKRVRAVAVFIIMLLAIAAFATPVFAEAEVATAIENTWKSAQQQIKTVVDKVLFPVIDMILAILFFVKLGTAYFDYRKHGQFELVKIGRASCGKSVGRWVGRGGGRGS